MKKTLLLTSLLLALTASVALAAGVNVAWGPVCYTENPTNAVTFACNTNSTTQNKTIVTSYMLADPLPLSYAIEWVIRGNNDGDVLQSWWKFQVGGCRAGKATASSTIQGMGELVCIDPLDGITKFDAASNSQVGEIAIIKLGYAVSTALAVPTPANVEYTSGGVIIANSKTVGTGLCAGCSVGMKLGLDYIKVVSKNEVVGQPDINVILSTPIANQCLSWNNSVQACARPVPARNTTWGQVKSLYR